MRSENDIPIGNNRWISWIDFDSKAAEPASIDDLLEPSIEFWKNLEVVCLAQCCGLGAFSFLPKDVENAIADLDGNFVLSKLKRLKAETAKIDNTVIESDRLNQLISKEMFLNLVEYLIQEIENRKK